MPMFRSFEMLNRCTYFVDVKWMRVHPKLYEAHLTSKYPTLTSMIGASCWSECIGRLKCCHLLLFSSFEMLNHFIYLVHAKWMCVHHKLYEAHLTSKCRFSASMIGASSWSECIGRLGRMSTCRCSKALKCLTAVHILWMSSGCVFTPSCTKRI
jgi:hypothetical protein